jgi:hypothetical protein
MTIRVGIAATAATAALVGLAAAVSSLLTALAHPLSEAAAQRVGDLFTTIPFLLLGVAGLALCADAVQPRLRRRLAVAWSALVAALCLAGPLVGPYAWLFEHATGQPADAWQAAWTSIPAWSGPDGLVIDLGSVRWPVLAGAVATAAIIVSRWAATAAESPRLRAYRRHLHVPRWHAPHSATP